MKEKRKAKTPPPFKTWLISKLRAACQKWPAYYETKKRNRIEVDVLSCEAMPGGKWSIVAEAEYGEIVLPVNSPMKLGRRVFYRCDLCGKVGPDRDRVVLKNGKSKKVSMYAVDHIEPVVGVEGFTTWDAYIARMFPVDTENAFQVVCRECHAIKTKKENTERKGAKDESGHKSEQPQPKPRARKSARGVHPAGHTGICVRKQGRPKRATRHHNHNR